MFWNLLNSKYIEDYFLNSPSLNPYPHVQNATFYLFIILWCFYPIPGHGAPLRGFVISLTGHTTIDSGTLDE